MQFQARDPDFIQRVNRSFAKQTMMRTLGAALTHVAPGEVEITLPFRADLTQQHGFLHAGVVTTVMDSACGYAALTVMESGTGVLSVEFKVQLLAPARGTSFCALGRVIRAGRTLTVVAGELRSVAGEPGTDALKSRDLIATLHGTMICVRERPDLLD